VRRCGLASSGCLGLGERRRPTRGRCPPPAAETRVTKLAARPHDPPNPQLDARGTGRCRTGVRPAAGNEATPWPEETVDDPAGEIYSTYIAPAPSAAPHPGLRGKEGHRHERR
jgi:hypothetical protein